MTTANYGKTLDFAGLKWIIRGNEKGSPANNNWREKNVWLDKSGRLHLKISKFGKVWTCAELKTEEKFLYGKFSFVVIGKLDEFDKNIVFGLFKYPDNPTENGVGEIDIEFARWGNEQNKLGNFTIWENEERIIEKKNFEVNLEGTYSEHLLVRTPQAVSFQSFHGHDQKNKMFEWNYQNSNLSNLPMPIYLNFWLYKSLPPSNLKEAEIIISQIKFEKFG